jgi:apolipoprotein N-acyltransferase
MTEGSRPDLLVRIAVTLVACSFMALEAPPSNVHLLQWVGLVPMFWVIRPPEPAADGERDAYRRSNRWLGYLYGLVGVALIFRWLVYTIDTFSNLPTVVAIAVVLLFSSVFGAPYVLLWGSVHPLRKRLGVGWVLAWPALWVVVEYLQMQIFLFPYNHGVGQYQVPLTWQIVSVTGIWGLTFLIFFGNAVLGECWYRWRETRPGRERAGEPFEPPGFAALGFGGLLLAVMVYGSWRFEAVEAGLREARVLRVAQLQSHRDMVERMLIGARGDLEEWIEKTTPIPRGVVDLVVWPEGATPYLNDRGNRPNGIRTRLQAMARQGGYAMVVGGGTVIDVPPNDYEVYNSVYAVHDDGRMAGQYDKVIPLPFGEYLPFGDYVPWLRDAIGGIGNFRAGDELTIFEVADTRIAAPICYEAILPHFCRRYEDVGVFINVTNDAWWGDSAGPWQHGMLAAARSTELGVPMIRSTYSGSSFLVEPHGVIHSQTGLFEAVERRVELRLATFPTIYARFGDWFVGVCVLLFVGLLGSARLRGPGLD